MTSPPNTLWTELKRLAQRSQRAIDRVASGRLPRNLRVSTVRPPPPPHVESRLEEVFDALAELPQQPNVGAALELASDALESELPTAAMAIALHDIDKDEMCFVVARGVAHELKGTTLPVAKCLIGHAAFDVMQTHGSCDEAEWIAPEAESPVLLCPIRHDRILLGLLAMAEPICSAEFADHDIELLRYVCDQLAGVIHGLRSRPPQALSAR